MFTPRNRRSISRNRQMKNVNSSRRNRVREYAKARRLIASQNQDNLFDAPEIWHEPSGEEGYEVLVLDPGKEYRHVVTRNQVHDRLQQLPDRFLNGLEVVQLSTMTAKKRRLPCYGLQWGCAIYLYPFHESMEEHFYSPPPQQLVIETQMYGARWDRPSPGLWRLQWTESTARDFQLNNILIHELGHLVDTWNGGSVAQERYAEWFAIQYGYLNTGGSESRKPKQKIRRRHHK